MKISQVESFAYAIPGNPYFGGHALDEQAGKTSRRYLHHPHYRAIYSPNAESMLVSITAEDGTVGYGEAQACIVPEVLCLLIREMLAPELVGEAADQPVVLRDRLYDLMRERGHENGYLNDAISACDMALWDLAARLAGVPLYTLLGGAFRDKMPCYVSGVPAQGIEEELEKVGAWLEQGFHRFKFSYPPTLEAHAAHLSKLRETFGDRIEILIDAHWAYNLSSAAALAEILAEYGAGWMECPLVPEDASAQAQLTARIQVPHALGEEYRTRYAFKDRLERGAIDMAQPDIGRAGVTEGKRIADLCLAFNVPVSYHLGAGMGVYTSATLHVGAATSNLHLMEFQPSQIAIADQYFAPSLVPTAGYFSLPPGPGLGITPDVKALRKFKL